MNSNLRWARRSPNSANNFDLILLNPQAGDFERLNELLNLVGSEVHRGLTLSHRASQEFRRFFDQPDTPLKSDAYILLSNWFMTQSGDRNSLVASRCEDLWDALFQSRPPERLSSPEPGRNHVMIPAAFESFWRRLSEAQGDDVQTASGVDAEPEIKMRLRTRGPEFRDDSKLVHVRAGLDKRPGPIGDGSMPESVKAVLDKQGLHIEVEGSPQGVANFLRIVSGWDVQ